MFVDTHAHIYLDDFSEDLEDVIGRAREEQVARIYMPNIDSTTIDSMMEVELRYPDETFAMMGLHPCSVKKHFERELYVMEDWFNQRDFCAVGEIGTDLYWDKTFWPEQEEALRIQLRWAESRKIPAILHCRDSLDETISIIEQEKTEHLTGIFHCFSGSVKQAEQIKELGFFLGIGGVSTFKNGGLDQVLPDLDLEQMVLETDSPYLTPAPFRGKRNEPSRVPLVATKLSELKKVAIDSVAEITTENANRLFGYAG
jgi:TatD DNase family protein